MAELQEYATVAEAALVLGCAKPTVHGYLRRGLLPAERKGNILLIPRKALENFEKPEPGNPALKRRK